MAINLIPTDSKKTSQQSLLAKKLTRVAIGIFSVFLLVVGVGGGALLLTNQELKRDTEALEEIRRQVAQLEQNEQQLILLKDRLSKAQTILASRQPYENLNYFQDFVSTLPSEVTSVAEVKVDNSQNKLTLRFTNSSAIANVVAKLENEQKYQNVAIESLTFDGVNGYTLTISVL